MNSIWSLACALNVILSTDGVPATLAERVVSRIPTFGTFDRDFVAVRSGATRRTYVANAPLAKVDPPPRIKKWSFFIVCASHK